MKKNFNMKKNFIIFEGLVDEAIYGDVMLSDVSSLVKKLKKEKANIIKAISALEDVAERRAAYKKLNRLMYQLYDARCCVQLKEKDDKGKVTVREVYISASSMANMILCYNV